MPSLLFHERFNEASLPGRLSAAVELEMLAVMESKVEYGCLEPSFQFQGDCKTGSLAGKTFPGDCERGPRDFQSNIIHHRIETQNQAVFAAGGREKKEIRVGY